MTRRIAMLALVVVQSGCSWVGITPAAPSAPVDGTYQGTLQVESEDISARLTLQADGSRLVVGLSTEQGVRATGSGSLAGTAVHAGLDYDHGCPGRVVLSGHSSHDGSTVSGSIVVADCTGRVTGSFSFQRVRDTRVDASIR